MNKVDTIAIIRSLLSSTNSSYSIYNLNKDFKNETGIDIPLFGYSNIGDFLNSIPDTVKLTGIYPIQQISLVTNQKSSHIVSLVKRQKNSGSKKKSFFKNKTFVRKAGVDLSCSDSTKSFSTKKIQESQIILSKRDVNDFSRLSDSFKDETSFTGEVMPTDLDLNLPLNISELQIFYFQRLVPLKDFWCAQETIPSIDLELHARIGEYVEVWPCQIFNPHKFYFHFRMFQKKFEDFSEKFQIFYSVEDIPKMKAEIARPKQYCAVFYKIYAEPRWHRAEIHEIISDSQVVINFIDYGKTAEVPIENLKLLHGSFMSLPRQAVLGFLANIRPLKKGSNWPLRAAKKFHELAFQKPLIAGVVQVEPEICCMGMALSCTKGPEIHINDTLVKEGYADFDIHALDSQFIGILNRWTLCNGTRENFNKNEPVNGTVNCNEGLSDNNLKSIKNVSSVFRAPVYFSNYNNNNNRLKKMFSLAKK